MTIQALKALSDDSCSSIASVDAIIEDVRAGKPVIIIDDENRENEGDIVVAAEKATPEIINFMAKEARGLICLPMEKCMIERLELPLMGKGDNVHHSTAFTVSIEAKNGVTTGISAADRAQTIKVAIDPKSTANDIATPGHVFPLKARKGGVLVRAGHTEAAVDLARLAGFSGAGVICEIMNDDGSMARLHELELYAKKHGLKIGTIADLIAYRSRHETLVEKTGQENFYVSEAGEFTLKSYRSQIDGQEHFVLTYGDLRSHKGSVPVRMHRYDFKADVFKGPNSVLHTSLKMIARLGCGILVLIMPSEKDELMNPATQEAQNKDSVLRQIGIGAQILKSEGVSKISLLTNAPKHVIGLEGYGLEIIDQKEID